MNVHNNPLTEPQRKILSKLVLEIAACFEDDDGEFEDNIANSTLLTVWQIWKGEVSFEQAKERFEGFKQAVIGENK